MCLIVKSRTESYESLTAKKDIVVYKFLARSFKPIYSGLDFIAKISGDTISGKISCENGKTYFCHNSYMYDGVRPGNCFGYAYSWVWDTSVSDVEIKFPDNTNMNDLFDYVTPYRKTPVRIGETYKSHLIRNIDQVDVGLHSFKKLSDCKKYLGSYCSIVKCIIPKGSKYYVGKFETYDSIASDTLTYVNMLKNKNVVKNIVTKKQKNN